MTVQEVIEVLQYERDSLAEARGSDYSGVEAIEYAIYDLEKQLPKPPAKPSSRDGMGYTYWDYYCPTCGMFLAFEPEGDRLKKENQRTRCANCGQVIGWDGEE